jgi:hypothetical protein
MTSHDLQRGEPPESDLTRNTGEMVCHPDKVAVANAYKTQGFSHQCGSVPPAKSG